jgi:hypothetical protein
MWRWGNEVAATVESQKPQLGWSDLKRSHLYRKMKTLGTGVRE